MNKLSDMNNCVRYARMVCMQIVLLAMSMVPAVAQDAGRGAGFRLLQLSDPVDGKLMKAILFYPAYASTALTKLGPVDLDAEENVKPRPGKFPLIVLSHGNSGSMLSHHDSGSYLARNGYLVLAPEHPGDNFRDTSGAGSDRVLIGRIIQVSAAIDQVLGDRALRDMVDTRRIGVAGFSAGGFTALAAVGAVPKLDLLRTYCKRQQASVLCVGGGSIRTSGTPLLAKADTRIRAAFVMNPVGAMFDQESLAHVHVPVYVLAAEADEVLPPVENAVKIRNGLPSTTKYREIPDAGHFVFLAPCSPQMRSLASQLCEDHAGVDRLMVHELLNNEMASFFRDSLQ